MKHTIKRFNQAFVPAFNKTIHALVLDNDKIFYAVMGGNGEYLIFKDFNDLFISLRDGIIDSLKTDSITSEQFEDDNYLISLFVKDFSKFTDDELVQELEQRNFTVKKRNMVIEHIDEIIGNIRKENGAYTGIFLTDKEKANVVKEFCNGSDLLYLKNLVIQEYVNSLPF